MEVTKVLAFTRCVDLTTLNRDTDSNEVVAELCRQAVEFQVAAVCVYPEFVSVAKTSLPAASQVRVASVANFPTGDEPLQEILQEIDLIVSTGGDEIDLVFPYRRFAMGDIEYCSQVVGTVRKYLPNKILKVILESGELTLDQVQQACRLCIALGADFIKTSTGKTKVGATLDAARVILTEIQATHHQSTVGFKVSGGIKTISQALAYANLAEEVWGQVSPQRFRIGASSLLAEVRPYL
ncbi:deoxyribose-phosphate aldolase [Batrachochytrium salamandrivorans]|nr:deoxyribose-phosphate aldolase [Batrachochytrium salamandrivorans]